MTLGIKCVKIIKISLLVKYMLGNEEFVKPDIDIINSNFLAIVSNLVDEYFDSKPMFSPNDYRVYCYDEYLLNTAVSDTASSVIYVEINQPQNFKLGKNHQPYTFNHDNLKVPNLYLPLKTIKDNLFDLMVNSFDSSYTIWKSKYAVELSTYAADEEGNRTYYTFKIIPCITYYNQNQIGGVMYYNDYNAEINVDYPKRSIINFRIKDKQTGGNLTWFTRTLKTTYMKQAKVEELPTEIYETIAYNVPNELLQSNDSATFVKIIKYLNSANLKEFKSIDEQNHVLASRNRLMSAVYVRNVIKTCNKLLSQ